LACVYKRDATYWIRFSYGGREVRRSARTASKAVAQQYLAQVLEEHRRLDRGGRARRPFAETAERFVHEYLPTLKPSTQRRYRVSLKQMAPSFDRLFLDEVNKARLSDYVTARKKAGASNATIRRDLATLSCLFTCAITWDFAEQNPLRHFNKRHLREAAPRTAYPSDAEIDALCAAASLPAARVIRFLSETGMRQEEVCGLEWSQVDLRRREVRLVRTKTSSPRVVPLTDGALGTILGTPRHITSPYVFWHGDGDRYTQFPNVFRSVAKRAGVHFRCHDLRHRFASVFLQRTGDLAVLKAILGHKTITMTMRYAHLLTEHLHEGVRKFAAEPDGTNLGTPTADYAGQTVVASS
jgi:site-specific recombinase XerD